jgi:hypothetical protein
MNTRGIKLDYKKLLSSNVPKKSVEDLYPKFNIKNTGKSPRKSSKKSRVSPRVDNQSADKFLELIDHSLSEFDNEELCYFQNARSTQKMAEAKSQDCSGSDEKSISHDANYTDKTSEKTEISSNTPHKGDGDGLISSQDAISWQSDELLDISEDEQEQRDRLMEKIEMRDKLRIKQDRLTKQVDRMSKVDNEITSLQAEISKLRKRKAGKTTKNRVDAIPSICNNDTELDSDSQFKLNLLVDLLKGKKPSRKAKSKAKEKLAQIHETSSSDTDSDSSSDQSVSSKKGKKGKKSKLKSGMHEKSVCADISRRLKWAPSLLEAGSETNFESMTFAQYVFGESGILGRRGISRDELLTRLYLMKRLAKNESKLGFKKSKELYKNTLLAIEKDELEWADFAEIDRMENDIKFMYMKFDSEKSKEKSSQKPKDLAKPSEDIVWCNEFNKGTCQHNVDHTGYFRNRQVKKLHICRLCWSNDKEKRKHIETDANCPHKSD